MKTAPLNGRCGRVAPVRGAEPPKEGRVAVLLDGSTKAKSVKLVNLKAVPSTCVGCGGPGALCKCAGCMRVVHCSKQAVRAARCSTGKRAVTSASASSSSPPSHQRVNPRLRSKQTPLVEARRASSAWTATTRRTRPHLAVRAAETLGSPTSLASRQWRWRTV